MQRKISKTELTSRIADFFIKIVIMLVTPFTLLFMAASMPIVAPSISVVTILYLIAICTKGIISLISVTNRGK